MKHVFALCCFFLVFSLSAQSKKELREEIIELKSDTAELNETLKKHVSVITELSREVVKWKREAMHASEEKEQMRKEIKLLEEEVKKLQISKPAVQEKPVQSTEKSKVPKGKTEKKESSKNPFDSGGGVGHGSGSGSMGDSGRIRLTDPDFSHLSLPENNTVYFRALINEAGEIEELTTLAYKTTLKDPEVLQSVMNLVKNQVRFNPKPGASLELVYLSIQIDGK